jgi:hypothetical protein
MEEKKDNKAQKSIELKKNIIDFFKVLTGFASGSILLGINFLSKNDLIKISEATICVKTLIIISIFCFTVCVGIGIFAMRCVLNTFADYEKGYKYFTIFIIIFFLSGYLLLFLGFCKLIY